MEQVTSFSRRFHLSGAVESQVAEFYRLAEVRGMLRVRGVSSTGLAMACLEIASGQHGEAFNKEQAQKLSGLPPRTYTSTIHSVEKMLNLSTSISLREMTVRFGCLEAEQLATETLHKYGEKMESMYSEAQKESLDLNKPLYSAAALYTACKVLKLRSDKSRFQTTAGCPSKATFRTVLDQMSDCVPKNASTEKVGGRSRKRKKIAVDGDDTSTQNSEEPTVASGDTGQQRDGVTAGTKCKRESLQSRLISSPLSQDYLQWKEAVLSAARAKLATQRVAT